MFVFGFPATAEGESDLTVARLWSSPDAPGAATLVAEWRFDSGLVSLRLSTHSWRCSRSTGRVYFAGASTASGTELWSSDGSAAGTARVADLAPGPAGS